MEYPMSFLIYSMVYSSNFSSRIVHLSRRICNPTKGVQERKRRRRNLRYLENRRRTWSESSPGGRLSFVKIEDREESSVGDRYQTWVWDVRYVRGWKTKTGTRQRPWNKNSGRHGIMKRVEYKKRQGRHTNLLLFIQLTDTTELEFGTIQ